MVTLFCTGVDSKRYLSSKNNITLSLPDEKAGELLKMYVYGLASGDVMRREDAAGGLVKLLTLKYIKGNSTSAELEHSRVLSDLGDVSDRQRVPVQVAFCEGILDATVKNLFRPKDALTNAEAVSILSKVIKKYGIDLNQTGRVGETAVFPRVATGPRTCWKNQLPEQMTERAG